MGDVVLKLDGLLNLQKALKRKPPVVKVGIIGSSRSGGGADNGTIGAAHEFGTSTLPQRSFLRVPISDHLSKELETSGAFTKEALHQVIQKKSLVPWTKQLAVVAEGIVSDAFDTGGFGKWQPVTEETMSKKQVKMILVETQQLRNSITTEVTEGGE